MTDATVFLLIGMFLAGFLIILISFMGFNYSARKAMSVDESMKRRTVRWAAVGSIWSGAAFTLATAMIISSNSEVDLPSLGIIAIALAVGIAWSMFLFGGVLLNIYWLQRVTLPLLRERKSEDRQGEKQRDGG